MKNIKILFAVITCISILFANGITGFDPSFAFGSYLFSELGTGYGSFRDEGTSPLRYQGFSLRTNTGVLIEKSKTSFELRYDLDYLASFVPSGQLMHHFTGAMHLSYMHSIPVFKDPADILKAGGKLSASMDGSYNPAYENAAFNLDIFSSLNAKMQYSHAFIIPERKLKRITLPKTHHAVVCGLEFPLLLFNARPEYPYVMDGNSLSYDRHIFLGGFSLRSHVGLRSFLQNGNAFEISYVWQMYLTGKRDIYPMEKAAHILKLSYYFRLD